MAMTSSKQAIAYAQAAYQELVQRSQLDNSDHTTLELLANILLIQAEIENKVGNEDSKQELCHQVLSLTQNVRNSRDYHLLEPIRQAHQCLSQLNEAEVITKQLDQIGYLAPAFINHHHTNK